MGCESFLLMYLMFVCCCLDQHTDPLRCLPHPRKHMAEFDGFILFPTLIFRILIYAMQRKKNSPRTRNLFSYLNVSLNVAFALWTFYQVWEILFSPRLADCKYNNHSMLEFNYVILIFFGLYPILIIACFAIYCAGLLPYACYKSCSN